MRKLLIVTLCLFFANAFLSAQPVGGLNRDKKIKLADDKFNSGDLYSAAELYDEINEADKEDKKLDPYIVSKLADINVFYRDYKEAEKLYAKLKQIDKGGEYPLTRFYLGRVMKMNEKFDDAITELQSFADGYSGADADKYKKLAGNEIIGAKMAKDWAAQKSASKPSEVKVESGGSTLNTPSTELSPISIGNDEILFASFPTDSVSVIKEGEESKIYGQIFKARRTEKGWSDAVALGAEVNKPGFWTASPTFSANKSTLYYTRSLLDVNVLKLSKIFQSSYSGGKFGEGAPLAFNSDNYSCREPAIGSVDGKEALFFASDMPGGKGGWDIWYAIKNSDGSFGTPLNVPGDINTVGDESTPYYNDGTLYFSSDGHPTAGGQDIFQASYKNASWGSVTNLGGDYNSTVDDFGFFINPESPCNGFIVSNRPGSISMKKSSTCCYDIFTVNMPSRCGVDINVKTFDLSNNGPLSGCTITMYDAATNKKIDEATNTTTNNVNFKLERGKSYKFVATKNGFIEGSGTIDTKSAAVGKPVTLEQKLNLDPRVKLLVKTIDARDNSPITGVDVVLVGTDGKQADKKTTQGTNEVTFDLIKGQSFTVKGSKPGMVGDEKPAPDGTKEVTLKLGLPMFDTIYYDFDKFDIRKTEEPALNRVISTLTMYPSLVVEVGSHCDAKGTDPYNDILSQHRTESAKKYLLEKGIASERLKEGWYGERTPAAPNAKKDGSDDPNGRQRNRRTVFKIVNANDWTPPQNAFMPKLTPQQEAAKKAADEKVAKAAAAKKIADEKAAAAKKIADEKAAAAKKIAEEKAAAAKKLADEKAAAAKKAAEEKAAAAKKLADEKAAKAAAAKKVADEKAAAAKKAADEKAAAAKKLADEKAAAAKKAADEKAAAAKKLAEEKAAAAKKIADDKAAAAKKVIEEKKSPK